MTDTLRLTWDAPATQWEEATPLGNGRIGAMSFGGSDGRYQLNDATVWSGTPDGPARALRERARGRRRARTPRGGPRGARRRRRARGRGPAHGLRGPLLAGVPAARRPARAHRRMPRRTASVTPARILDLDEATLTETLRDPRRSTVRRRSWVSAPAQALIVEITADAEFDGIRRLCARPCAVASRIDRAPDSRHDPRRRGADRRRSAARGVRSIPLRYADDDTEFDALRGRRRRAGLRRPRSDAPTVAIVVRGARRLLIALSTSSRAASWWADADGDWRTASREAIRDRATNEGGCRGSPRRIAPCSTEHVADRRRTTRARFAIGSRREGAWNVDRDVLHGPDPPLQGDRRSPSSACTCSRPARERAAPRRTCRASGTTSCSPPGRRTTRSTSTPR